MVPMYAEVTAVLTPAVDQDVPALRSLLVDALDQDPAVIEVQDDKPAGPGELRVDFTFRASRRPAVLGGGQRDDVKVAARIAQKALAQAGIAATVDFVFVTELDTEIDTGIDTEID
jgi:hypothetical protein